MVLVREADAAETKVWAESRLERLRAWYGRFDGSAGWTDRQVARKGPVRDGSDGYVFVLMDDDAAAGYLAVRLTAYEPTTVALVDDLWVHPDHRRRGIGSSAREWAEEWARDRAKSLFVTIDQADRGLTALFASYPIRAQTMMKRLAAPAPLPAGVEGRPMTTAEYAGWLDDSSRGYAADIADSGSMSYPDAMARSMAEFAELLPLGLDTPGHTFWTIYAGDTPVATNWLRHGYQPDTSFVYGVEVHEGSRGKGYGRAAMIVGERAGIDAGDTHLALNVFGHNQIAINLYTAMAYHVVEQNRSIDL